MPKTITAINNKAFDGSNDLKAYLRREYKKIVVTDQSFRDPDLVTSKVYFYSEEKPSGYKAWHYADDGETILIW